MEERSEGQLIADYLKGDEKSLEILIQQYLKPIFSFVYRYVGNAPDAEDLTQEVFVRVWKNIKKFDQARSFKAWIFNIAKNASIDHIKKKKAIPFSRFENAEGENIVTDTLTDKSPSPLQNAERQDMVRLLTEAVDKLSEKYRLVLRLHYNSQLTFQEIADNLGESIDTVKSRHRRAVIELKKTLKA
jgi:RNA polymerase sigma-70 factor (ECF subfamily)